MLCPSVYGSKMILDRPNKFGKYESFWTGSICFRQVQFVLIRSKSFGTGPNHKNPEKSNMNLTKIILDLHIKDKA